MTNYFGLTVFSLFKAFFQARNEKKEEPEKGTAEVNLENPNPPDPNATPPPLPPVPAEAGAAAAVAVATAPQPAAQATQPVAAMNDKPISTGYNIKVINQSDEYGNYNQIGIVSNVLEPKKDELAKGITEKRYLVKMSDGKTYPYYRNEIENFN